jgi:ribosomal protein L21E
MAQKFKNGERVQLKNNISQNTLDYYGLKPGDEGVVTKQSYGSYYIEIECPKMSKVMNVGFDVRYLDHVKSSSREKIKTRIETLKQEIADKNVLIDELSNKIKYMDETGTDTFDENEFKAYQTLTIIEKGNLSKLDKARAIAALLNQK